MLYSVRFIKDDVDNVKLFECNKDIELEELDYFIWDCLEDGYSVSLSIVDDKK